VREVNVEKLTKRAIAIYSLERSALISGDMTALRDAADKKAELLADLNLIETQIKERSAGSTAQHYQGQLASLHSIIHRRTAENCQLAKANNVTAPAGTRLS
jgi:hypothetical protein